VERCLLKDGGVINILAKSLRRSRPVARFQGLVEHNIFLGGQYFYYHYMFKTNFAGRKKIRGAQKKFGGHFPRMPPVATGLRRRTIEFQLL